MSDEQINPSKKPRPQGPVARDVTHEVVAGLGVVRKLLFQAPISYDGWQKMMLTHIAAAKNLGFTMFEIDAGEGEAPRPPKKKQEASGMISSMFYIGSVPEGDEWKVVATDEDSTSATSATIRTTIVRVYALAVE